MNLYSQLKRMKTLLVDDDNFIRDSFQFLFRGEGCPLVAVETAEQGLEILKDESFDIILCDYRLPGMNGLTFLKRLKEVHPNGIKILITAYASPELVNEAIALGVHDFVRKPFSAEAIEKCLSRLLERQNEYE